MFHILAILVCLTGVFAETINTPLPHPNTTNETQKDNIISQLNAIQEQLETNQRKIQYLEWLRKNPEKSPEDYTIRKEKRPIYTPSQSSSQARPNTPGTPTHHYSNFQRERERSESFSLQNKIRKAMNLELSEPILQSSFLTTKPIQRNPEEPGITTFIVFLTVSNKILIYDTMENFVLLYQPGHQVKSFTVNPLNDEYFIATLGTDNTIRLHSLGITRVKSDESNESGNKQKGKAPGKFVLDYNLKLEYIFDLEHNTVVPESLFQQVSQGRVEKNFNSLAVILSRAQKMFGVINEDGALLLINKNGTLRGQFRVPDSKIISLHKFYPNPLFATEKSIGFFSPLSLEIINPSCDIPGDAILKIEVDQYSTNHFQVLLKSGVVLLYEAKQSGCKIVAKKQAPLTDPLNANMFTGKNFAFIQKDKAGVDLLACNLTDPLYGTGDIESFEISIYPFKSNQDDVSKSRYISTRSGPSSTLFGAYFEFENSTSTFTLYEMTLTFKASTDWLATMRLPIIAGSILLVIIYQFFKKNKKVPKEQHVHGPDCRHEHEDPYTKLGSRAGKGKHSAEDDLGKKFNASDLNSLRDELNRLENMKAQKSSQSYGKKKVTFEDDELDENDHEEDEGSSVRKRW